MLLKIKILNLIFPTLDLNLKIKIETASAADTVANGIN
jgi:hypothetical protein